MLLCVLRCTPILLRLFATPNASVTESEVWKTMCI